LTFKGSPAMDIIIDIFATLFYALMIYISVRVLLALFSLNRFIDTMSERSHEIREHLSSIIHPVKSETHDGVMYWYDAEDNTFLVQGRDDAELAAALKARWIDHIFIIGDRYLMSGPDFAMIEITDPEEIGKMLADRIINKKESNESRNAS
jgi:hypothetical protein